MDFLMGLNDSFENVRSQILGMDPLSSVNKAFFLVQQIETQIIVTNVPMNQSLVDMSAFVAGRQQNKLSKEEDKRIKMDRYCEFCKQKGHLKDTCFKLNGYPEWFKGSKGQSSQGNKARVNTISQHDSTFDLDEDRLAANVFIDKADTMDSAWISAICQEVVKVMKDKGPAETSEANFAGPLK